MPPGSQLPAQCGHQAGLGGLSYHSLGGGDESLPHSFPFVPQPGPHRPRLSLTVKGRKGPYLSTRTLRSGGSWGLGDRIAPP